MRPIRLTISAFGPYAGTEQVDFREATDAGLFGIYGPTGSGKSSIFSAMTFALFGEGAKREQSIATMRSGHADADQPTEVSLLFEIGERRYYIRRQPDQTRPKKRGDGETTESHKAWLFDATEVPVEEVTADNCGVVLAETKVGEVARLVKELLGYGVEQFRQIVLLPQGRFERFLVADSNERVAILRELFDVSVYRRIAERMKEQAASARRDFDDGHRIMAQRLADAGFASTDELETGIAEAGVTVDDRRAKAVLAETAARDAEKAHLEAERIEGLFAGVERADRRMAELEEGRPAIEALEVVVARAQKAQRAVDLETRVTELRRAHGNAVVEEERIREAARLATEKHAQFEAAAVRERREAEQIDGLLVRAAEVERHRAALVGAGDLKADHEAKHGKLDVAQTGFDRADAEKTRLDGLVASLAGRIDSAQKANVRRSDLTANLATAVGEQREAKAHADAGRKASEAKTGLDGLVKAHADALALVGPLRDQAADAERAFIGAQAQVLADMHLVDGEPCPVCGSAEHPSPARGEGDPRRLETEMRSAREASDAAVRRESLAEAAVKAAGDALADRQADLALLPQPRIGLKEADAEVARLKSEIATLGTATDVADLETQSAEAKRLLGIATTDLAAALDGLQRAKTDEAVSARSYADAIESVPVPLRAEGAVDEEARKIAGAVTKLREKLAEAEDGLRKAATDRDTAAAKVAGAVDAVAKAEVEATKAVTAFGSRLTELELDPDQYAVGREAIPHIAAHEARIGAFRKDFALSDAQAAAARASVGGLERPDTVATAGARDVARGEAATARGVAADAEAARKVLEDLRGSLRDQLERLAKLEEESGPLRALAEAFVGDNVMRTPLETFAIGAMFDHVLDAANLRLDPMTAGRYRLVRDVESVGGRTKRGLDIRVHDIQTGRAREISTLSGGETFIAALSLALGLSDIVEMSHGRIRLDTIFIDEGFGSLDTENDGGTLDLVLQVLQEIVGKSRAVGLISHVPLVQQAVPNGFSIVKTVDGSRVERRVA
ncbi:AAA family ATPase [Sphingomonas oryzagri]|uniref:SMC family ATPase n=1 Tax=Sphingomonas oryzagri TaxID=3042314 RepID=A0ABT6N4D1_9SPHN|nr:SMC family ATPase [Sphingomonas oryzagri]MDH7639973.1 SMC family ATPase [Sphingomonas oryzagri]